MSETASEARLADPILMEVFSNRLLSITEEMGTNLIRASFSTNIKERRDCSVGLFDIDGRLIAQAAHIPLHLGSLLGAVEAVRRDFPLGDIAQGDAFFCNDPYLAAGTHMPDISVVTPVFVDGAARYFTANIGHHADVGGRVPGSIAADALSVFEEGIRIPATRIRRESRIDRGLLRLIAENTREPEERTLDLQAQIAANDLGARRLGELIAQVGLTAVTTAIDDILVYTATRLRNRIRTLTPGAYSFTTYLDDDGGGNEKAPIHVTVRVAGDRLDFDFAGSAPQSKGALNVPESGLKATVFYAVKALLDPGLLPNSGLFEAVRISAPEGSIVNPSFPAAVGARSITCQKIAGAIFGAFRGLLPQAQVMASSNDVLPAIVFSGRHRRHKRTYVYLETLGGGAGARLDRDGMDGVQVHVTNTSNLPVEALENEYPLLVEEYGLVTGSGGAGRSRGGLGIARQIRALEDGTVFGCRSDSHLTRAEGVFGGEAGVPGRLVHNPDRAEARSLSSKVSRLVLAAGESMRIETPGGGGAGPASERSAERRDADRRSGKAGITHK
ncbi:MAG TPA: hydantoinase B/oxoprolinase family protein [Stellaceae bacterium]|jgi:N-methylhydantoinase B|nr:hydantoinase B/oxoprolinase family protein [Stellaceae bacterium]